MSQLGDLIYDRARRDPAERIVARSDGVVEVPWQAFTLEGGTLVVHFHTNRFNEPAGIETEETGDEVRVTVLERQVSDRFPGARRRLPVPLDTPLGDRVVVDGATGRPRERFVPDAEAGWADFERAAAEALLGTRSDAELRYAARDAVEDGCDGAALAALAAGAGDLEAVYRERGKDVPGDAAAAKLAVDGTLREASADDASADSVAFSLIELNAAITPEHAEQIGRLVALAGDLDVALENRGEAHAESERLLTAAREMHARGGLRL